MEQLRSTQNATKTRCPRILVEPLTLREIRIWRSYRLHWDAGMSIGQVSLRAAGRTISARGGAGWSADQADSVKSLRWVLLCGTDHT